MLYIQHGHLLQSCELIMKKLKIISITFLTLVSGQLISGETKPPEYVFAHYIKENSFPEKGEKEVVKKDKIYFKNVDANGDESVDWYLDDPNRCGSQGCNGSVYLFRNKKYCFGGYEARHTVGKIKNNKLQCSQ